MGEGCHGTPPAPRPTLPPPPSAYATHGPRPLGLPPMECKRTYTGHEQCRFSMLGIPQTPWYVAVGLGGGVVGGGSAGQCGVGFGVAECVLAASHASTCLPGQVPPHHMVVVIPAHNPACSLNGNGPPSTVLLRHENIMQARHDIFMPDDFTRLIHTNGCLHRYFTHHIQAVRVCLRLFFIFPSFLPLLLTLPSSEMIATTLFSPCHDGSSYVYTVSTYVCLVHHCPPPVQAPPTSRTRMSPTPHPPDMVTSFLPINVTEWHLNSGWSPTAERMPTSTWHGGRYHVTTPLPSSFCSSPSNIITAFTLFQSAFRSLSADRHIHVRASHCHHTRYIEIQSLNRAIECPPILMIFTT